jgi:hypothetical protein
MKTYGILFLSSLLPPPPSSSSSSSSSSDVRHHADVSPSARCVSATNAAC